MNTEDENIQRYIREFLGTPEQILEKIARAEAEDDLLTAYGLASEACEYGIIDLSAKKEELMKTLKDRQRKLLESAPFGEIALADNGLFGSVCCEKMKQAVLNDEVGAYCCDCTCSCMSLCTTSPEMIELAISKLPEGEAEDYEGCDYMDLEECPYCGKRIDL